MVSYVRKQRRLSDEEIVSLYRGGLDSDTIAARAGCHASTVLNLVRAAGHEPRKSGGTRKIDGFLINDAEICRRYREGASGPELADAAGCSVGSIYNLLRRNGVEPRDVRDTSKATLAARKSRLRSRPLPP
jgi:DNA-binding CsgD family transcriptional regulator